MTALQEGAPQQEDALRDLLQAVPFFATLLPSHGGGVVCGHKALGPPMLGRQVLGSTKV